MLALYTQYLPEFARFVHKPPIPEVTLPSVPVRVTPAKSQLSLCAINTQSTCNKYDDFADFVPKTIYNQSEQVLYQ